jgi:hypothetical protein
MSGGITSNYVVTQTSTRHVEQADQKFARKNDGESLAKAPNQNIEAGTRGAFKSSVSFFKDSLKGFFDAPMGKKLEFLKDRVELRSIQKSEVKEMQRLDRQDASTASERKYSMPKYDVSTASGLLLANPKAPADFRPVVSSFMGSLLKDAATMMKDAEKNGKPITREEAFQKIADTLVLYSSAADFTGFDVDTLRSFANDLKDGGRTEKSAMLNAIIQRFELARTPEEAVKLFKDIALDHSKNAPEQSFLRAARGNDGITQKYVIYGGKSGEILTSSKEVWNQTTSSEEYKTLESEIRKLANTPKMNLTLVEDYGSLSETGKQALAKITREFIGKIVENGVPETLQGVLKGLQEKIIAGGKDVNPKVSQLFVSAFLKNVTPSITDSPTLFTGVDTSDPSVDTKPLTNEEKKLKAELDRKTAAGLASMISATITAVFNSGLEDNKTKTPELSELQTEVILPLSHEVTSMFTKAGMSKHGETERTRISDKHAEVIKNREK